MTQDKARQQKKNLLLGSPSTAISLGISFQLTTNFAKPNVETEHSLAE